MNFRNHIYIYIYMLLITCKIYHHITSHLPVTEIVILWTITGTPTAVVVICVTGYRPLVQLDALLYGLFFLRNIKLSLQVISFLHNDMTHVAEILSNVGQELYHSTNSISWELISWRRKEPVHQQQIYWLSLTRILRSQHVENWYSCLGPVSLRLMTSQFKDIVTYTQK